MKINIFAYEALCKKKLIDFLQEHTEKTLVFNPEYAEKLKDVEFVKGFINASKEEQIEIVQNTFSNVKEFEFTEEELYEKLTLTKEELKTLMYE